MESVALQQHASSSSRSTLCVTDAAVRMLVGGDTTIRYYNRYSQPGPVTWAFRPTWSRHVALIAHKGVIQEGFTERFCVETVKTNHSSYVAELLTAKDLRFTDSGQYIRLIDDRPEKTFQLFVTGTLPSLFLRPGVLWRRH